MTVENAYPAEQPASSGAESLNGSTPAVASVSSTPKTKANGRKTGLRGEQEKPTGEEQPMATRSLAVVLRAVERHQARAIMLKYLADVALEAFHGLEGRPPTKLVRLPNGIRFAVEPDDAVELHLELARMASEERSQLVTIHQAAVQIEPSAVDLPATPYIPGTAPPDDPASTVDNPAIRTATASSIPRGAVAGGSGRPGAPAKPDEWGQAVGASNGSRRVRE